VSLNDDLQRRLAHNEVLYRKVNEAIERGLWPGEGDEPVRFRCECARLDCNLGLELTVPEYEGVRENPRRFLLHEGHQVAGLDVVVERHPAYLVVEKEGQAGIDAEESDPRSP
jgi:hypothetical protein